MHSPEYPGIEPGLQFIQRSVIGGAGRRRRHHHYIIFDERSMNEFAGLDKHEPFAHAHGQLIAPVLARLHGGDDALQI